MSAATALVAERGYYAVGIEDIGAAVGISGPALYRHYATKEAVLAAAIYQALRAWDAPVETAVASKSDPDGRLKAFLSAAIDNMIERRSQTVLLLRELNHLPKDVLADVSRELEQGTELRLRVARAVRPDLDKVHALHLLFGIRGLMLGGTDAQPAPRRPRLAKLLLETSLRLFASYQPNGRPPAPDTPPWPPPPWGPSRREQLLIVATELFTDRGYNGVSMGDIGAALGVTASSVYEYFDTKAAVVGALLGRAAELLAVSSAEALGRASSPEDAVRRLVDGHIRLVGAHPKLIGLYLTESRNLPLDEFPELDRARRAYVTDWIRALEPVHDGLPMADVRVLVWGMFGLVAELVPLRGVLLDTPDDELAALALDIVLPSQAPKAVKGKAKQLSR